MKKTSLSILPIVALGLAMLSACGGASSSTPQSFQPTTAVLTLSTAATSTIPASTTINGYNVTIPLPAGVTVKTLPNSSGNRHRCSDRIGQRDGSHDLGSLHRGSGNFSRRRKDRCHQGEP